MRMFESVFPEPVVPPGIPDMTTLLVPYTVAYPFLTLFELDSRVLTSFRTFSGISPPCPPPKTFPTSSVVEPPYALSGIRCPTIILLAEFGENIETFEEMFIGD